MIAFVAVLVIVLIVSAWGMIALGHQPVVLQGQIESTEIRISGKLPGRIDTFLVKEGQQVKQGDTLVVINSPEGLNSSRSMRFRMWLSTRTRR